MKRFLTATAVASVLATGAFAATQEETSLINRYAPNVDVSMMTDEQVAEAVAIATTDSADTEKRTEIEAILSTETMTEDFSPDQLSIINEFMSSDQIAVMSADQRTEVLRIMNSGAEPDQMRNEILALYPSDSPALTEAEAQRVQFYAPEADLSVLTAGQTERLRAAINSGQGDADIKLLVDDILS